MVQLQELRKGNYVWYNTIGSVPLTDFRFENPKEWCRVKGMEENKVVLEFMNEQIKKDFTPEIHTDVINISPVRLTPEILEACHFSHPDFKLQVKGETHWYNNTEIRYLHQLQNKYEEVTGAPLQVNLSV